MMNKEFSDKNQKRKTEPKLFRDKIKEKEHLEKEMFKLSKQIQELNKYIKEECPHKVKYHTVVSHGREDDYGSWEAGRDYILECTRCKQTIAEWGKSDGFFGVDKNGKSQYGHSLEYYKKLVKGTMVKADFDG